MTRKRRRKLTAQHGARQTGTKSPLTIPNSSRNSLQHGSNCRALVLACESPDKFQELLATYMETFQPTDGVEMKFVEEMVAAKCRQQRIWLIQTAALDLETDSLRSEFQAHKTQSGRSLPITEASLLALSFTAIANKEKTLELLHRHEISYTRMHDRAMKALYRLRAESKLRNDPKPPENEPAEPEVDAQTGADPDPHQEDPEQQDPEQQDPPSVLPPAPRMTPQPPDKHHHPLPSSEALTPVE